MRRSPQIHQRNETPSANHAELKLMCQTARQGACSGALVGRGFRMEVPNGLAKVAMVGRSFRNPNHIEGRGAAVTSD
jgi:hypothetical protein